MEVILDTKTQHTIVLNVQSTFPLLGRPPVEGVKLFHWHIWPVEPFRQCGSRQMERRPRTE